MPDQTFGRHNRTEQPLLNRWSAPMQIIQVVRGFMKAVALSLVGSTFANAADLKILAPNAVKDSVVEIAARFEKETGHRAVLSWAGTESITKRISDDEVVDVVVNAAQNIDKLIADRKVTPGTRTDFAKSAIGIAVPAYLPKPDVSSVESLKQALLKAKSIAISSGTSGRYLAELFERLGVGEQVKGKIKQPPSGAQIGDMLARGEADLGFQQVSELVHVKGIEYVGPLPKEVQSITVYSAGIHAQAAERTAAKRFLEALRSPQSAPIIKNTGMDPA
jgi:molybdate transport system substrate-binding protein